MREGVSPSCVVVPPGQWPTLLDFLHHRLPRVGKSQWMQRMAAREVVDGYGQPVTPDRRPEPGLRVYYYRHIEGEVELPLTEQVLFQDEYLLVVDKPHFMPVVPTGRYVQQSLLVRLKKKLGLEHLTPIHRIDRETAGLVMFSIQPHMRNAYQTLFRERQVFKHYEAVAPYQPGMSFPITRTSRIVESEQFFKCCEVPGTANSETLIELQQIMGDHALYRLTPITGKRHQLRVHMNALGLPIRFDHFYPEVNDPPEGDYSQPLQLLARRLSFTDPITGDWREFVSRLTLLRPPGILNNA